MAGKKKGPREDDTPVSDFALRVNEKRHHHKRLLEEEMRLFLARVKSDDEVKAKKSNKKDYAI